MDLRRVCLRCALRHDLDQLLPPASDGALLPLREPILAAEPFTTRRWLSRAGDLLTGLHRGTIALDHVVLDDLPQPKAVAYLRALLVSTGVLPPDPMGPVRRLAAHADQLLTGLADPDQQVARSWVRWQVLPRLRRRAERGHDIQLSARNDTRKIDQAVTFLIGLRSRGRTLATCTQTDIDDWFAGPGAIRWTLRPFLTWSCDRRHLPAGLSLPPSYKGRPLAPGDAEHRWTTARSLLQDGDIDVVDRVAGCLVVLYAQPVARIVTLTTADLTVTDNGVQLHLGPDPLDIPEPLASLIRALPVKRRNSAAHQLPNAWLFPGSHAEQHLHGHALATRLRRAGIEPRASRLAAADQLARDIPPAMLAGVLGLKTASVARTVSTTAGQWAVYIIDR